MSELQFSTSVSISQQSLMFTAAQQAGRPVCIQGDAHVFSSGPCVIS